MLILDVKWWVRPSCKPGPRLQDAENETLKMQNQTLRHTSSHQAHTLGGATRLTESVTMEVITNTEGHLDFTVVNDPDCGAVVGIVDDGSPADFAGLIAGCRFEKVNGLDVVTSTADEVLTMLTQVEGLNCEIVVTRGASRMLMMPKVLDTSLGFRMDGPSTLAWLGLDLHPLSHTRARAPPPPPIVSRRQPASFAYCTGRSVLRAHHGCRVLIGALLYICGPMLLYPVSCLQAKSSRATCCSLTSTTSTSCRSSSTARPTSLG